MAVYGLVGFPLGHSFSRKYFTDKFETEGIAEASFELMPMELVSGLREKIASMPDLRGFAVTIPHKQAVIHLLDHISDEAKTIGAVNCIKVENGILTGYNTDVAGFEQSLVPLLKPHHQAALVFGTGGASKAVQYALRKIGIPYLLVSRDASATNADLSYTDIDEECMNRHKILINASPAGMTPDEDSCPPIPYEFITPEHLAYDLVYKPAETKFLGLAGEKGATCKNGFDMLIIQAEANWKIWNS